MVLDVGSVEELSQKQVVVVQAENRQPVAVFAVGETFFAVDELCPHRAGPLSEGKREGNEITCPWHSAKFDLETGEKIFGPGAAKLRTYPVTVANGRVQVTLG